MQARYPVFSKVLGTNGKQTEVCLGVAVVDANGALCISLDGLPVTGKLYVTGLVDHPPEVPQPENPATRLHSVPPPPAERCDGTIPGATPGTRIQCERPVGHLGRHRSGDVWWAR